MIESGASLQTPTAVQGGMTAAGFQGVRATYHKPGPELRDTVVRWSERVLQAMLSHSLLRLGEAESMDAARRRTGELVEEYMRECPEMGGCDGRVCERCRAEGMLILYERAFTVKNTSIVLTWAGAFLSQLRQAANNTTSATHPIYLLSSQAHHVSLHRYAAYLRDLPQRTLPRRRPQSLQAVRSPPERGHLPALL